MLKLVRFSNKNTISYIYITSPFWQDDEDIEIVIVKRSFVSFIRIITYLLKNLLKIKLTTKIDNMITSIQFACSTLNQN